MQVSNPNNIKIYNLSAGKSLPEWLTDRKKRALQNSDIDIQRRIELIQDFEMPTVSHNVQVSPDGQYIFTTGVYKPRIRCYETAQLSLKFERCLDSEIVKLHFLSEDYTKVAFMLCDRYVEFHAQEGRYYRTRLPKYGRDLDYHTASCDMYFVGASPEIYRLNLEQGRFMKSLKTNSSEVFCCQFNPAHHLFACGTAEGHVECWDPRTRNRVGLLDCAASSLLDNVHVEGVPAITSIKHRDALNLAVGTSTGQILLYDMRSDKPLLVKDHNYDLPIKNIQFLESQPNDMVMSMDKRILKIWDRQTGKPFTSIEPGTSLNDLCVVPKTGMVFMANEDPKIQTYYIPALGPAPRWCSFLDSLTEELEENPMPTVYDDYRFVTRTELDGLGMAHLIGSNLLRAYMHGFFMDVRLYNKAKSIADPFAYEDYRRAKIREKIDEERQNRVQIKKLPKVNRMLAEKLLDQEAETTNKKKKTPNLMKDDRFKSMFENPAFQVDMESEDYKLLNPLVSKLDKDRKKKQAAEELKQALQEQFDVVEGDSGAESSDDSSDDEHTWTKEMKEQHKLIQDEQRQKRRQEAEEARYKPKFMELKDGIELKTNTNDRAIKKQQKLKKRSLGDRLRDGEEESGIISQKGSSIGNMEMTFKLNKSASETRRKQEAVAHHKERKKIRRSAGTITKGKPQSKFFMGKRVH